MYKYKYGARNSASATPRSCQPQMFPLTPPRWKAVSGSDFQSPPPLFQPESTSFASLESFPCPKA